MEVLLHTTKYNSSYFRCVMLRWWKDASIQENRIINESSCSRTCTSLRLFELIQTFKNYTSKKHCWSYACPIKLGNLTLESPLSINTMELIFALMGHRIHMVSDKNNRCPDVFMAHWTIDFMNGFRPSPATSQRTWPLNMSFVTVFSIMKFIEKLMVDLMI